MGQFSKYYGVPDGAFDDACMCNAEHVHSRTASWIVVAQASKICSVCAQAKAVEMSSLRFAD